MKTSEKSKHKASGYSSFKKRTLDATRNKLNHYGGRDCMERFCKDLKEHVKKIINYKKKEMIPLTIYVIYTKKNLVLMIIIKNIIKSEIIAITLVKSEDNYHYTGKYRGAAHDICNLRYKTPKEISVVFDDGSTYDYHCIIKKLAKEFDGQFLCLEENTEKYKTSSVPCTSVLDNGKTITYKIKFNDSFRFMASSLTSLVDNLFEGLHKDKCINCKSCLYYMMLKDDQLIFRCFGFKKSLIKETLTKIKLKDFQVYISFVIKILINLFCY